MGRGSDSADDEAPKPALPTLDSGDLTWAKRDEELLRQGFGRDHAPPQVAHVPVLVLLDLVRRAAQRCRRLEQRPHWFEADPYDPAIDSARRRLLLFSLTDDEYREELEEQRRFVEEVGTWRDPQPKAAPTSTGADSKRGHLAGVEDVSPSRGSVATTTTTCRPG
jgi:hypothetical protein